MRKRIISESFENRMQELSGIIQENAHKIMKLGFDNRIADYLANIDKKRGLFLADSLTTQYIKDNGLGELEGLSSKEALSSINQEDLFNYMKSRENESLEVVDFIKQGGGQIDVRSLGGFNDIIAAAKDAKEQTPSNNEEQVGFGPDVESYLRGLDYDFGTDIGAIALRGYFKHKNPDADTNSINLGEMVQSIDELDFLRFLKENENETSVILDWVNSPLRQENEGPLTSDFLKSNNFQNLGEALFVAENWHTHIQASGKIKDQSVGRVIERYPDGYYWKDLQTNSSKDEAQAMGHCGTDGKATTLISLRDDNDEPHVTIAYNENNKNVTQVKGKNNKRPIDKYMTYVNAFLANLVKSDKLQTFNWSYRPDLKDTEVDKALENLSAKAKFKLAKRGAVRKAGRSNLGVRY